MSVNPETAQARAPRLRLVASKPRLKKLLELTSINGELDTIWLRYGPNGISQSQVDPSYTMAVIARFSRAYFTEYSTDGEGEVKVPHSIYNVVSKYLKEVDNIELKVEGDVLALRGRDEVYEGSLLQVELPRIEVDIEERDYGFVPATGTVRAVYGVDSEEWYIKADEIKIHYGSTLKLTVDLEEGGTYTRGAKVLDRRDVAGSGTVAVDGKTFRSVVELFTGPIYLVITDAAVILSQRSSDYLVSFILALRESAE